MFYFYSTPIMTQIPGMFCNNYIEKHETHQDVKLSLFVHKFRYGYDINLKVLESYFSFYF